MNKKAMKLLGLSLLSFFVSVSIVNAKKYDNLEDLTKDLDTWREEENKAHGESKEISYIFIIGEHVFTSNYIAELNSSEMFNEASRTIPMDSKVYIYEVDKNGTWDIENKANLYNNGQELPEVIDIKYTDGQPFGDKVDVNKDIDSLVKVANDHANDKKNTEIFNKYELEFDATTSTITFNAKDPKLVLTSISKSGIAAKLMEILKSGNYNSFTLTEIVKSGTAKTATINANATTDEIKQNVMNLFEVNAKLADLAGKSYKIEFKLADDKVPANNEKSFTLKFTSIIDTDEFFISNSGNGGSNVYAFSCPDVEGKHCTPVVNVLNPNYSQNGTGVKKLQSALDGALKDARVSSVYIEVNGKSAKFEGTATVDINSLLAKAVNATSNDYYAKLAKLGKATIKFTLADGVESIYENDGKEIEYTLYFGEYVNTDNIVDQIVIENNKSNLGGSSSSINEYYNLSRKGNKLTLNTNLVNNSLRTLQSATNGLEQIIYKSGSGVIQNNEQISKIVVIDNNTSTEYELKTGGSSGKSLTEILKTILNVVDANSDYVSPTMLKNLNISIRFEIASTKELIPGLNGYGDYTEGKQSATYDVSFKINNFDVKTMLTSGFSNKYLSLTETDKENVYNLNVTLKDVNTTLKEANLLGNLGKYIGLFKSITITVGEQEPVELDLSDVVAARKTIDEVLKLNDSNTLADLYDKEFTLKLVLADDVNLKQGKEFEENTNRTTDYTVNVKLTYAKQFVENGANIQNAITSQTQVIDLDTNGTYGADLTISESNDNIVINGNGATITGDVEVKANNVTFNNVNITGKLFIPEEATASKVDEITIKGNGNTTITGAVDIKNNANVTIEGMKIVGTNKEIGVADEHSADKTNAVINVANGTGTFTLKKSKVSYSGGKNIPDGGSNKDLYVYSLVYIDGNAVITENEFDITNVKNPIEYKYGAVDASDISIKGNKFTGNNYVKDDAHNVISFYGAANNSTIEVTDNKFEYANWAIRISNTTPANKVTYIITGNTVSSNNPGSNKTDRNPLALIGVQEINDNDLANITIVYDANTAQNCVDYKTDILPYHTNKTLENGESALVYAYKSGNGDVADNYPTFKTLEKYNAEKNNAQA